MSGSPAPDPITGYHAHVYYNDDNRPAAAELRAELVGPHPEPMYQVAFGLDQFSTIVPWLMLHRRGLTVLVHPDTGNDVPDHRDYPLWLGAGLDLDLAFLERHARSSGT